MQIKTEGSLPDGRLDYELDAPTAGKVRVKINAYQQDILTTVGNITGQPSGVTVRATSGGDSVAEATHTHAIDHNHASFASAVNANNAGGQTLLDALGPNLSTHTHTLDLANLTATSGAGTSHMHRDNTLYRHQHALGYTSTNSSVAEVANGTNLSTTVWYFCAFGVKA